MPSKQVYSQLYLFSTSVFDMDAVVCLESDWQTDFEFDFDAVFNVNKKKFFFCFVFQNVGRFPQKLFNTKNKQKNLFEKPNKFILLFEANKKM